MEFGDRLTNWFVKKKRSGHERFEDGGVEITSGVKVLFEVIS